MKEIHGVIWDNEPEMMELCLNCKYEDCIGDEGCRERMAIISKMRGEAAEAKGKRGNYSERFVEMDGETRPLTEWCRIYGVKYRTVWQRIKKGWDAEKAIKENASKGGARNYGQMIRIGDEKKNITEWLREYHIGWKTINRYTRKNMCSRAEAVRALVEKKRARLSF